MNDLQAQITANSSQAVAAIDHITASMDRFEKHTKRANKEAADLQKRFYGGFKETGAGVAKAGGALGSIGGRALGGIGMGGPIGILAVSLTALTVALTALKGASDRSEKAVEDQIAQEKELIAVKDEAHKRELDNAQKGLDQAPARRRAIAIGGQEADQKINELTKRGVDPESVANGILKVQARYPGTGLSDGPGASVLAHAETLASVGMKFDDAVTALIEKGGMNSPTSAYRSASLVYKDFTGHHQDPETALLQASTNVAASKGLQQETLQNRNQGEIGVMNWESLATGILEEMRKNNLADAMDPLTRLFQAQVDKQEAQLIEMRRAANAQFDAAASLEQLARIMGMGEGSAEQKMINARKAINSANNAIMPGQLTTPDR